MATISSYTKQILMLEFSSLKHTCPDGIYVTLTPADPLLWSGVLFVRHGPYSPSVLRFHISFPPSYPSAPPLVTFSTEMFHPLLTPLTTQTYAPASSIGDGSSAVAEERLPPGGFSLRHGFPRWFSHEQSMDDTEVPVFDILEYIRAAFNDEDVLNSITSASAVNPGAYHAWHAYCAERDALNQAKSTMAAGQAQRTPAKRRQPGEWNWQGVWEQRVRKGIAESLTEAALYGTANSAEEIIRFSDLDEEATRQVMEQIARKVAIAR